MRGIEPEVLVAGDPDALARLAADTVLDVAANAINNKGSFRIAFSGGSTPRALFSTLASDRYKGRIDWARWQVFFSDERFVPPDSPESNYHMAREVLLSVVPIPREHVYPVPTVGISPQESATRYERTLLDAFAALEGESPRFDLILLGLGPDGHTASLFPETEALTVKDRGVVSNYVPRLESWRITFTYPLINAADVVAFLVQGEDKAVRVHQVLTHVEDLPAAGVRPEHGRLMWLLDRAAALQTGESGQP